MCLSQFLIIFCSFVRKEINGIRGTLFIRGTLLSFNIVSRFSIFISLVTFVYFGNMITARKVFIITSYFNFLYSSVLHFWPLAVSSMAEVFVSIKRVQDFLLLPEDKETISKNSGNDDDDELEKLLKVKLGNGHGHDAKVNGELIENVKNLRIMNGHGNVCRRVVVESSNIKGLTFVNATARWLRQSGGSNAGMWYIIICHILVHSLNLFTSLSRYRKCDAGCSTGETMRHRRCCRIG